MLCDALRCFQLKDKIYRQILCRDFSEAILIFLTHTNVSLMMVMDLLVVVVVVMMMIIYIDDSDDNTDDDDVDRLLECGSGADKEHQ